MKITIKRVETKPVSIEAFADENGLEMEVNEREPAEVCDSILRFYAGFHGAEMKDGGALAGASGQGKTIKAAIKDYAKRIQGKTLVVYKSNVSAAGEQRKPSDRVEIQVPKKLHCQGIKLK